MLKILNIPHNFHSREIFNKIHSDIHQLAIKTVLTLDVEQVNEQCLVVTSVYMNNQAKLFSRNQNRQMSFEDSTVKGAR